MTLTIAGTDFDQHEYDDRGDVLYLASGHHARPPVRSRLPRATPSTTTSPAP